MSRWVHGRLSSGDGIDLAVFGGIRSGTRRRDAAQRLLDLAARPDRFELTMELFRSRGGAWCRVTESSFVEGDRLRVDLSHAHDRELFVYLLDVGLTADLPPERSEGIGHLVLVAGESRLSTARLLSGAIDSAEAVSAVVQLYRLRRAGW